MSNGVHSDACDRSMTDITEILNRHAAWVRGEAGGVRANLDGAELCDVDLHRVNLRMAALYEANLRWAILTKADLGEAVLSGADLSEADLRDADLSGAILSGANLRGARLHGANLIKADLSDANLIKADLSEASLRDANLCDANLRGADLSGADLRGATFDSSVPVVPRIDVAILAALDAGGGLNMSRWHCDTAHCRGGWAITCAGAEGQRLEEKIGSAAAAALIYAASRPSQPVPDFHATDAETLADLRGCAAEQASLSEAPEAQDN